VKRGDQLTAIGPWMHHSKSVGPTTPNERVRLCSGKLAEGTNRRGHDTFRVRNWSNERSKTEAAKRPSKTRPPRRSLSCRRSD
jgi:hypothetical protein